MCHILSYIRVISRCAYLVGSTEGVDREDGASWKVALPRTAPASFTAVMESTAFSRAFTTLVLPNIFSFPSNLVDKPVIIALLTGPQLPLARPEICGASERLLRRRNMIGRSTRHNLYLIKAALINRLISTSMQLSSLLPSKPRHL